MSACSEASPKSTNEQVELLSLLGHITRERTGEPNIHAHVVLGEADGTAVGGHLVEAIVRPTLELILSESPAHLRRRKDPATGLALIDLQRAQPKNEQARTRPPSRRRFSYGQR